MNSTTRADRVSGDELRVWRSFLVAYARVTRRLEADLIAEHSLPLASYDVLVQLVEAPGHRLRMTELAERVLLTRSGLTRLVDRLVKDDLVWRELCEYDARGFFAVLTPVGHDRLRTASRTHLRGVEDYVVGRFSAEQLHKFAQLLSLLDPTSDTSPTTGSDQGQPAPGDRKLSGDLCDGVPRPRASLSGPSLSGPSGLAGVERPGA